MSSKAISFATDQLTPTEANGIFNRDVGKDMPTTYTFVASSLHEQLGIMFNWFKDVRLGASQSSNCNTENIRTHTWNEIWVSIQRRHNKPEDTTDGSR